MNRTRVAALAPTLAGVTLLWLASAVAAQENAEKRGSDNIEVVSHLPLGGALAASPTSRSSRT